MNRTASTIVFCSSSYLEYDRRLQRIIATLSSQHKIIWISRAYDKYSKRNESIRHQVFDTFFKSGVLFYLEMNLRIFFLLLNAKCDIVSAADVDVLLPAYLVSKLKSKMLVFDSHEIFHEVPELVNKPIKKKLWYTLSKILFTKIHRKYTVNNSLKNYFSNEFGTEFGIVRNVPLLIESEVNERINNKCLCYLGVVNFGRGVELAIQALKQLDNYTLIIIGEGDLSIDMKLLVNEMGLSNRVQFTGYVQPNEIDNFLAQGSIGLNILDPLSDNYKYSLANKFFDYIHVGLPSINMNFPEYQIINESEKVSILIDQYSVDDLIQAVKQLENKELYQELYKNCMKARLKYNWQEESKVLETYYRLDQ